MKKHILIAIALLLLLTTGCTLFKKPLDKKTGFSSELDSLEGLITTDSWEEAGDSLLLCLEKWKKVKPWMQLELDHDVINEIEIRLTELTAYMETEEKPAALSNVRAVKNIWEDIGSK
jgi:hypothetical protein